MKAALLQAAGLIGLPIGGAMISPGAGIMGASVSLVFVGLALEYNR